MNSGNKYMFPQKERTSRRTFLRGLSMSSVAVLLASCGAAPQAAAPQAAAPTSAATLTSAAAPTSVVAPTSAAAPTSAPTQIAASAATTRTVTDSVGRTVQLPVELKRLVAGYTTDMDVALALDLPLVAGPGARGLATQAFASYQPKDRLANVTRVTTFPEANFEQIAAIHPDCILDSVGEYVKGRIDSFSHIAPTIDYSADSRKGWRDALNAVAKIFDQTAQAERFIADYDSRAAALRTRLAQRWPNATYAIVSIYQAGSVQIEAREDHAAKILTNDLGIKPAAVMPATFDERPQLSLERLDLLKDADWLLLPIEPVAEGEGRDRSWIEKIGTLPLWQQLPAIQNKRVIEYYSELSYASPLTSTAFLDVVEKALLA